MDLFAETKVDSIAEEPVWVENGTINEAKFVGSYLAAHPMKCVEKVLYDLDGQVDPGMLEHDIYTMIKPYLVKDVPKVLRNIMKVIEVESYAPDIPLDETHIHFQNGTYCITDESFTERKVFCRNRLPVRFVEDAPIPEDWLCFLDELFYTEDIYAIQEFLGYALIPSNRGQTMMVIVGDGGEGKSTRLPRCVCPGKSLIFQNFEAFKAERQRKTSIQLILCRDTFLFSSCITNKFLSYKRLSA